MFTPSQLQKIINVKKSYGLRYISHFETKDGSLAIKVSNMRASKPLAEWRKEFPISILYFGRRGGWQGRAKIDANGIECNREWAD